jgi:hypothetical protein
MSIYICNILIAIVAKLSLDIVTFDRWVGERAPEFLIWESLKVIVFSWQALSKRLPTRSNLPHIMVIDAVLITKEKDFWSYVNGGVYTVSSN